MAKPYRQYLRKRSRHALRLIQTRGPLSAREFAEEFWPDGFAKFSRTGRRANGLLKGAGATLRAGRYLRWLVSRGWLTPGSPVRYPLDSLNRLPVRYDLTERGMKDLRAAEMRSCKYGRSY